MDKVPGDLTSSVDTVDVPGESHEAGEVGRRPWRHVRQQGAGPTGLAGSGRERA